MSLILLHTLLRFLVIRRGGALLYGTVPYRTGTVQPPYCPYCTVLYGTVRYRYRTVQVPYRLVRYDTVRYGTGTGTAVFNIEFIQ